MVFWVESSSLGLRGLGVEASRGFDILVSGFTWRAVATFFTLLRICKATYKIDTNPLATLRSKSTVHPVSFQKLGRPKVEACIAGAIPDTL